MYVCKICRYKVIYYGIVWNNQVQPKMSINRGFIYYIIQHMHKIEYVTAIKKKKKYLYS